MGKAIVAQGEWGKSLGDKGSESWKNAKVEHQNVGEKLKTVGAQGIWDIREKSGAEVVGIVKYEMER